MPRERTRSSAAWFNSMAASKCSCLVASQARFPRIFASRVGLSCARTISSACRKELSAVAYFPSATSSAPLAFRTSHSNCGWNEVARRSASASCFSDSSNCWAYLSATPSNMALRTAMSVDASGADRSPFNSKRASLGFDWEIRICAFSSLKRQFHSSLAAPNSPRARFTSFRALDRSPC